MKKNKLIFSCIFIIMCLIPAHLFSQGYNGTILVYYNGDFTDPFDQDGEWDHLDPDDIKSAVTAKIIQHFQTQFGISVTDNTNDSWHLKIDIGGPSPGTYFGYAFAIGDYIDQSPTTARVYSEEFSEKAKFQDSDATVARISNAIAGTAIHELAHKFNCRHPHCFDHYDTDYPDWLDGSYYPLEPDVLLSNGVVDDEIHHPHTHFMASCVGAEWISLDERAESRHFSDHSINIINLAKNGYITPSQNMAWGLPNRTFTQGGVIQINAGKDFKFAGASYTHNMNNYHIYAYGSFSSLADFENLPGPNNLSVESVNSPPRMYLSWDAVTFASNYNIYRKVGGGSFSLLTNTGYTSYYDSDIDQQATLYTYYIKSYRSQEWNSSSQESETSPGPLTGNISYDVTPTENDWVYFTANVTSGFGSGSYSYDWYRAPDVGGNPGTWSSIGGGTQTIYFKCSVWPFHLKCDVDDNTYTLFSGTIQSSYGTAKRGFLTHGKGIPASFGIAQNYPNPFNPDTKINFQLPEAARVTLKVYDVSGREVAELVNGNMNAGYHSVTFNAHELPSGVYIYKIKAGKFIETKRMILMK
ncbi:T9SS type A sorting domain-containing protein [candidate division KSB1 bacterium]